MESATENILSLKNVTMDYGGKRVLNGVNLEVSKGQIIGYIGPNGAGRVRRLKSCLG